VTASPRRFRDRPEAGRALAAQLGAFAGRADVVVLALPRGGVPVGAEVAGALGAPLDVYVVRKLGLPSQPELAMGAVASGGTRVLNDELVASLRLSPALIDAVAERELVQLAARERIYRGDRPPLDVKGKAVVLVDDGLATGASMRAAVAALRLRAPASIAVAVPVAPEETRAALERVVDELVVVSTPHPFVAVGLWYVDFSEVSDDDVRRLLDEARR
jgi:predicted phosphoribosyltransferase